MTLPDGNVLKLVELAAAQRQPMMNNDPDHHSALRLFTGFYEGCPELVIDLYAKTLVIFNYAQDSGLWEPVIHEVAQKLLSLFPFIECVLLKTRESSDLDAQKGKTIYGSEADRLVIENGVRYGLNLRINQDASFYLDTRNLRQWLKDNTKDKTVLNTFAYTGSLGIAAMAGGAARVVQTDLDRVFLNHAKGSYALNNFAIEKKNFIAADFFSVIKGFKDQKALFDYVILDPPFFSVTEAGKVDQQAECLRLINKVRPLIADGGKLIAINNALFLSGKEYADLLDGLCSGGYLSMDEYIPVPEDCTGYPSTVVNHPPVDTAPFNHPTKIAMLSVKRK